MKGIKVFYGLFFQLLLLSSFALQAQQNEGTTMQIKLIVNNNVVNATLNNSAAARDFAAMLPLTLVLRDYGQTEKVSDLARKLSIAGSPSGYTPARGDIAYYEPWGNLAIFRRDFWYSNRLIKLGQIDDGLEVLDRAGEFQATIELVKNE